MSGPSTAKNIGRAGGALGGIFGGATAQSAQAQQQLSREIGSMQKKIVEIKRAEVINTDLAKREADKLEGQVAGAFAGGNIDVSGGSPLLVQAQSKSEADRQVANVKITAMRQEFALQDEISKLKAEKKRLKGMGFFNVLSDTVGAVTSILGG